MSERIYLFYPYQFLIENTPEKIKNLFKSRFITHDQAYFVINDYKSNKINFSLFYQNNEKEEISKIENIPFSEEDYLKTLKKTEKITFDILKLSENTPYSGTLKYQKESIEDTLFSQIFYKDIINPILKKKNSLFGKVLMMTLLQKNKIF